MTTIREGSLEFHFESHCQASKYDEWSHYRNQFQPVAGGCKAIDVVCVEDDVSWLIEIKDYRRHARTKGIEIADEIGLKVRDSLAGLASAAKNANEIHERKLAKQAVGNNRWRVVLHLEQRSKPHRLWPRPIDSAKLLQKFRTRKFKAIDPHPIVCDRDSCNSRVPWSVR
ncbi:MAG: hypothetical protein F4Y89_06095 [Gammaproteobacteria bacterium]|nr:hypothetical protein [Gammaproteobacteria bacterium]MYG96668.1 hypothetical protein [Gammaproteobacteria bacterium]